MWWATAAEAGTWLVGVRNDREALSTWWVTDQRLEQVGRGLAAPTPSGWARVDVVRHELGGLSETDVRVVGPGDAVVDPPFDVATAVSLTGTIHGRVMAVGLGWWTVETVVDGHDRRGELVRSIVPVTGPFPPPPGRRPAVAVGAAAGPEGEVALSRAGNTLRGASPCLDGASLERWGVRYGSRGAEVYGRLATLPACPPESPDFRAEVAPPFGVAWVGGLPVGSGVVFRADAVGLHLDATDGSGRQVSVPGAVIVLVHEVPDDRAATVFAEVRARLAP